MHNAHSAWLKFLATRIVGLAVDSCVMAVAYWGAFALRLDFTEPIWGWRAMAQSFLTVWVVQVMSLLVCMCYRLSWRLTRLEVLPRYILAALLSALVFALMRVVLPSLAFAHVRPPLSITIINAFLFLAGLISVRYVWRIFWQSRVSELDLLNRPETHQDPTRVVKMLHGNVVAVTGAGGTIGSELVRQILACGPTKLLLIERGENALYQIEREVRALATAAQIVPVLADVRNEQKMHEVFAAHRPRIVFHAAAYKHVPIVETNVRAGVENNTLATRVLGEVAIASGVEKFVLISTDKAVNPVGVMGITKRLAEILLMELNARGKTIFAAVRFGNVLGSSGSVVPLFREQIEKRRAVTITHRDMKRYFMSTLEAVSLVLQAGAIAKGNEIFVLDMGKEISILNLAENMISQRGLRPYVDIPIVFTGIRPGERLFEELGVDETHAFKTDTARIFIARDEAGPTPDAVRNFFATHANDDDAALGIALKGLFA